VCSIPLLTVPKAFAELDIITNGAIESDDVIAYEKQFYIRAGQQEADWLIREYDADEDGMLDEEEFQQLLLPATNVKLRAEVERRPAAAGYRHDVPLDDELCK